MLILDSVCGGYGNRLSCIRRPPSRSVLPFSMTPLAIDITTKSTECTHTADEPVMVGFGRTSGLSTEMTALLVAQEALVNLIVRLLFKCIAQFSEPLVKLLLLVLRHLEAGQHIANVPPLGTVME